MIISMADILKKAKQEHYGVAAPNVFNDKTIEAAFQTSAEFKAPVILDGAGRHGIGGTGLYQQILMREDTRGVRGAESGPRRGV